MRSKRSGRWAFENPDQLLAAIDAALDRLRADGTVEAIYGSYGIALLPPR
jgi:ABC-type amino acid transport substrate-binding protein